jgi:hypothetical protein
MIEILFCIEEEFGISVPAEPAELARGSRPSATWRLHRHAAKTRGRGLRRVAVTGLGVVSPLGNGADAFFAALAAGRSGMRRHRGGLRIPLNCRVAAPATIDAAPTSRRRSCACSTA